MTKDIKMYSHIFFSVQEDIKPRPKDTSTLPQDIYCIERAQIDARLRIKSVVLLYINICTLRHIPSRHNPCEVEQKRAIHLPHDASQDQYGEASALDSCFVLGSGDHVLHITVLPGWRMYAIYFNFLRVVLFSWHVDIKYTTN